MNIERTIIFCVMAVCFGFMSTAFEISGKNDSDESTDGYSYISLIFCVLTVISSIFK